MDRLTQLQDQVEGLTEIFKFAYGESQRLAPPIQASDSILLTHNPSSQPSQPPQQPSLTPPAVFAADIVRKLKIIDLLIDSLPHISVAEDKQLEDLAALETENRRCLAQRKGRIVEAGVVGVGF